MNKDHNHIIHITKSVSQNRLDREFNLLDSIELLGESLDIYVNGKTPSMDNQVVIVIKSEPNPDLVREPNLKTNRYEEIFIMVLLNKNDFYYNYSDDIKKIADSTDKNVLQLYEMEYSNSDFVNSKLPLIIYKLLEKNNFDVYIGDKVYSDASDPSQEKLVKHLIDKTKKKLTQESIILETGNEQDLETYVNILLADLADPHNEDKYEWDDDDQWDRMHGRLPPLRDPINEIPAEYRKEAKERAFEIILSKMKSDPNFVDMVEENAKWLSKWIPDSIYRKLVNLGHEINYDDLDSKMRDSTAQEKIYGGVKHQGLPKPRDRYSESTQELSRLKLLSGLN